MKVGTRVKMAAAFKRRMATTDRGHVEEFGRCVGTVEGPVDYGRQLGPELNVRWAPSGLRYGYAPEDLVLVN